MTFKTKEELIEHNKHVGGKNYDYDDKFNCHSYDNGYKSGIEKAFSTIKERVDFFFKYFNDMLKFKKEQPDLWKEYWFENKHTPYPIWVAEYCFGDLHDQKGT